MVKQTLPLSLKIVAWLFLLGGVSDAIEMVVLLMDDHIKLNFGVIGIFVGIGLLKRNDGWRVCGLVLLWISLILGPIILLLMLSANGPIHFNFWGRQLEEVNRLVLFIFAIGLYVLLLWQRAVLSNPGIKAFFRGRCES
jgi:hypothetical protein